MSGEKNESSGQQNEKELEEARLLSKVFEACEEKSGQLERRYGFLCDSIEHLGLMNGRKISEGVDTLRGSRQSGEMEYTEALVNFINARFGNANCEQEANDLYLSQIRSNNRAQDDLGYISTLLRNEDRDGLWDLSRQVDRYGNDRADADSGYTDVLMAYIYSPSKKNREALESARTKKNVMISRGFSGITAQAEENEPRRSEEAVDSLNSIKNMINYTDEVYDSAVIDYIQFKMGEAGVKEIQEAPQPSAEALRPFGTPDNETDVKPTLPVDSLLD